VSAKKKEEERMVMRDPKLIDEVLKNINICC